MSTKSIKNDCQFKAGDAVVMSQDCFKAMTRKPVGRLHVKRARIGDRSGLEMVQAVDETGHEYTACNGCFSKVGSHGGQV